MPAPGQSGPTGPRPHTWKSGPDPVRHAKYTAWGRARAQAHFRGEAWALTFEDWETAWGTEWHRRGRGADNLFLVRCRPSEPWSIDNVERVTRPEFNRRQHSAQRAWREAKRTGV
jgi:hypothetical protein